MAPRERGSGMDRDMPWGWWLRAERACFVDQDGRTWRSVRDAFWQGHLNFPPAAAADEQNELLLRVLTALSSRFVGEFESIHDLFEGDMTFWRFYNSWLVSIGLVQTGADVFHGALTDEGRAVMLMLQATREPGWVELPMADVIEAMRFAGRGEADRGRESALTRLEAETAHLPWIFGRSRIGGSFLISLTGLAVDSRMPTRRIVWTQSFSCDGARDDLFAWMACRVDRWEDWGRMAYERGADALTRHLLALVVVSITAGDP